jgi:hypothetical protein
MTPKDELDSLLNEAIGIALRLVEKHGSHIPFCMAISTARERVNVAAADTGSPGADAPLSGVRQHIVDAVREKRYRAVALAQNVEYQSAQGGSRADAVQGLVDTQPVQVREVRARRAWRGALVLGVCGVVYPLPRCLGGATTRSETSTRSANSAHFSTKTLLGIMFFCSKSPKLPSSFTLILKSGYCAGNVITTIDPRNRT